MKDVYEVPDGRRRFLLDEFELDLDDSRPGRHRVVNLKVVPVTIDRKTQYLVAFTLLWEHPAWWDQTWVVVVRTDENFESPSVLFETPYDEFAELIDAVPLEGRGQCLLLYSSKERGRTVGPRFPPRYHYLIRRLQLDNRDFQFPSVAFLERGLPGEPELGPSVYRPFALGGVIVGDADPIAIVFRDPGEFGDSALVALRLRASDLAVVGSVEISRSSFDEVGLSPTAEPRTGRAGWMGAFRNGSIVWWFHVRHRGAEGLGVNRGLVANGTDRRVSGLRVAGGRFDREEGPSTFRFCVAYRKEATGIQRLETSSAVFAGDDTLVSNEKTLYGPSAGPAEIAFDSHSQCHWMLVDKGAPPLDYANPANLRRLGATGTAYTLRRRPYFDLFDVAFDHRDGNARLSGFVTAFLRREVEDKRTISVDRFRHSSFTRAYRTEFPECARVEPFRTQFVNRLESVPLVGHARFTVNLVGGPTDGFVWLHLSTRLIGGAERCEPALDMVAPGAVAIQAEPSEAGFVHMEVQLSEALMPGLFRKDQRSYIARGEILDYPNLLFAQWVWPTPRVRLAFPPPFEFGPDGRPRPGSDFSRPNPVWIEIDHQASNVLWIFVNE